MYDATRPSALVTPIGETVRISWDSQTIQDLSVFHLMDGSVNQSRVVKYTHWIQTFWEIGRVIDTCNP